jgi:hypothetical protein
LNDEYKFAKMRSDIINMSGASIVKDLTKLASSIKQSGNLIGVNLVNGVIDSINRATRYLNLGQANIKKIPLVSLDTGGFTGEFGSEGRLAMLHEKELVLNKNDTSNMLKLIDVTRNIINNIKLPNFSNFIKQPSASTGVGNIHLNFNVAKMTGSQDDIKFFMNEIIKGVKSMGGNM